MSRSCGGRLPGRRGGGRRHEAGPAGSPGSRHRLVHWAAVGVFAAYFALGAETGQVPPNDQPAIQAEATAVLVDVVVTDDRGRAVRGLSREHFQVYEDGVEQEIVYFAEIGSPETPVASEAAEAKSAEFEDSALPPSSNRTSSPSSSIASRRRPGRTSGGRPGNSSTSWKEAAPGWESSTTT